MIEEIIKPDVWKISNRYNDSVTPIIIWGIIGVSLVIISGLIANNTYDLWGEQVNEQVRGLECDQLEEAYNIYKLESIKERFVFNCLGQKEPWYK